MITAENRNGTNKPDPPTVPQQGKKLRQCICAIIACIGAAVVGCGLAWTSPNLKFLSSAEYGAPFVVPDVQEQQFVAAFMPLGATLGALPSATLADVFGRKLCLMIFTILSIASWMTILMARDIIYLYVGRFVCGIVIGLFCSVIPMYVNEIAEKSIRGTLGTLFQLFITIGILFTYTIGITNSYSIANWIVTGIVAVFLVLLLFIEESPSHMLKRNNREGAQRALQKLRGSDYNVDVELDELQKELDTAAATSFSLNLLFVKANFKAVAIAVCLMFFQQFAGTNAVIFFAEQIFSDAGMSSPTLCSIISGIIQTLATLLSSALIENLGRRVLMLVSSLAMGVCLILLGFYFYAKQFDLSIQTSITWLPLIAVVGFFTSFSLGVGPIPWMIGNEVLALEVKNFGLSAATATNWLCTAIISFYFQQMVELVSAAYTFWFFAVICVVQALFVVLILPETKNKSLREIQQELS